MAPTTPSTAYSRDLGDELKKLRESTTNLTGRALAVRLGWDPSKVSNIENGKVRPSEVDLIQFLMMCGKDLPFFEDFKQRYRRAFDDYIVLVPENLRTVAMAEASATTITAYDVLTITGLLQTDRYADGLYRHSGLVVEERIPALVQIRGHRQAVLRRHDRPDCLFYIHELALRQRFGDDQVMEEQYLHLLFNVRLIRIVPADVPAISTGLILWEFEKALPVAFNDSDLAKVFVQEPGAIARIRLTFDRLKQVALDEEQSRQKLMEYISLPREGVDERGPRMA
ncbi:helix-turn-helix transcriptional regulator [Lentzea sp. NPDC042327]|uniref:helix-turn-helix domain-containing protein n=1 Tax=Lentzea sp. NPDC042327 TaxID=3154801 RepID=UPI0033E12697